MIEQDRIGTGFLQGIREDSEASGVQVPAREQPLLVGGPGQPLDRAPVPSKEGRVERRRRVAGVAEEAPKQRALGRWYRKAAEQRFALGQFNLGWCYENGRGIPRDLNEARKWYRKAAVQGHDDARKRLSMLE
jgi:TPR repeat protein